MFGSQSKMGLTLWTGVEIPRGTCLEAELNWHDKVQAVCQALFEGVHVCLCVDILLCLHICLQ